MVPPRTAWRGGWSERLRLLGVGVLSGVGVGLGAAISARLVMRLIAVALGRAPMLTAATFVLLRTGLYDGILMGLLFVAIRRYLPGVGLGKGVAFGVLLLALAVPPAVLVLALAVPPAVLVLPAVLLLPTLGELRDAPVLGTGLFAALFLATGIAEAAAVAWLERRLPAPRRRLASLVGYGLLTGLAVYTVLSFVIGFVALLRGGAVFPHLGGH